jgi:RNA polymerase sigma-70 factor (ECF subfamily)
MTATPDDTNELLRKASGGDAKAIGGLFTRHQDRLRRMVDLRMDQRVRGRLDPSDVLQEAYLEFARSLADYLQKPDVPFYVWLRMITGRKLQTIQRRHLGAQVRDAHRDVSLFHGALPQANSECLAAQLLGRYTTPSEAASRAELQIRVQEALNCMDPIDREILSLRHFELLSNAETARAPRPVNNFLSLRSRVLRETFAEFTGLNGGRMPLFTVDQSPTSVVLNAVGMALLFVRDYGASIAQRYRVGRLGRGWIDNFDISLTNDSANSLVTIHYGHTHRPFLKDKTSAYSSLPGDFAYTPETAGPRAHAISSTTFPSDTHMFFDYDSQGRLVRQQRDGGAEPLTFIYGVASYSVKNALGNVNIVEYDDLGLTKSTWDGLSRRTAFGHSAYQNLLTRIFAPDGASNRAKIPTTSPAPRDLAPIASWPTTRSFPIPSLRRTGV